MGNPNCYSLDIPVRCLDLLTTLLPVIEADKQIATKHDGPLTTTLTLALATPMLMLPIERIQKHLSQDDGYANDRELLSGLAKQIDVAVRGKTLSDQEAFSVFNWSYLDCIKPFNIAAGLENSLADQLSEHSSRDAALAMDFATFLSCLRNSLSHGGIIYLDDHGRSTHGQASMLCFVSARHEYPRPEYDKRDGLCKVIPPVLKYLRLLRISETDFRNFLAEWVGWLNRSQLNKLVSE